MDTPLSMQLIHYKNLIEPHLRREPDSMFLGSLYSEAWKGWALGATTADAPRMLFVEWLCEELAKNHEQEFTELISSIVSVAMTHTL